MTIPSEISAYLEVVQQQNQEHWSWSYAEEKQFWRVKFTGTLPACEIHVELNGPAVCFQVDLGHFHVKPECRAAFNFFLLRLNEDLPVVKFGLGERGQVVLMAEALASQVSLNTFEELLQAMTVVLAQYRREMELLAADHELANLLLKPLETAPDRPVSVTVVKGEPNQG